MRTTVIIIIERGPTARAHSRGPHRPHKQRAPGALAHGNYLALNFVKSSFGLYEIVVYFGIVVIYTVFIVLALYFI